MSKLGRQLLRVLKHTSKTVNEERTGKRDWGYDWFELKCAAMDTLVYSWWTPIKVFIESCERTIKWLPIVWKDRHWDHWFILEILRHKIRFQRECISKYGHHVRADIDCHNMRIAEILIKRLQDNDYSAHHMQEIENKWGELEFGGKWGLSRTKVLTEEDREEESKEHKVVMAYDAYMKNQDYDYLFKHLKKHLERWWD